VEEVLQQSNTRRCGIPRKRGGENGKDAKRLIGKEPRKADRADMKIRTGLPHAQKECPGKQKRKAQGGGTPADPRMRHRGSRRRARGRRKKRRGAKRKETARMVKGKTPIDSLRQTKGQGIYLKKGGRPEKARGVGKGGGTRQVQRLSGLTIKT